MDNQELGGELIEFARSGDIQNVKALGLAMKRKSSRYCWKQGRMSAFMKRRGLAHCKMRLNFVWVPQGTGHTHAFSSEAPSL